MKKNQRSAISVAAVSAICICLIILVATACGSTPTKAKTTSNDVTSVFVASDLHGSTSNLKTLLEKAKSYISSKDSESMDDSVLVGDNVNGTSKYKLSDITANIRGALGNNSLKCYYTYGSHDKNATSDRDNYFFTGAKKIDGAYLYGIDYDGMTNASSAKTESAAFTKWIDDISTIKPIIVCSHVPLHKRRGDNDGASIWLSALNSASSSHNIIFIWGHNHTGETSADTSVYYVKKGGYITAQGSSSATKLKFTYMNAGYIKNGFASTMLIGSYNVKIYRFSKSGIKNTYAVSLIRPTSIRSLTGGSKKVTVKWTKQTSNATGYQLQYSLKKNLDEDKKIRITSLSQTSKMVKNLKAKKTYYFRIRTYKYSGGYYYSVWSAKKSVKTRN